MGLISKVATEKITASATEASVAPVQPAVGTPTISGAKKGTQAFVDQGKKIYSSLNEEAQKEIASGSSCFEFLYLLGAQQMRSPRKENNTLKESFQPVGMVCRANADLKVPVIPFAKPPKDTDTRYTFDELQYRDVKKGEEFVMTRVEAMFMVTNPENKMGGYIAKDGNDKGVALTVKVNDAYYSTKKLPTPAFNLTTPSGSIKEDMVAVDEKVNDQWVLKPAYAEKFAALLVKTKAVRQTGAGGVAGNKKTLSSTSALALALGETFKTK